MSELVVVVVVVIHLTLLNYVHNVNCQFARYLNALWMTTNDINSIIPSGIVVNRIYFSDSKSFFQVWHLTSYTQDHFQ